MTSDRHEFARGLRKHSTRAEDLLWRRLRGSRFHGAKFRRQVKLVVELDGNQHDWFSEYDAGRTKVLERMGVRVLRVTNEEVCGDLDAALARVYAAIRLPFD